MSVPPEGYRRLVEAFLAGRASANTRTAYRRDLAVLAHALAIETESRPDQVVFGVEEDVLAKEAARELSRLPAEWWQHWRDGLEGTAASRRRAPP